MGKGTAHKLLLRNFQLFYRWNLDQSIWIEVFTEIGEILGKFAWVWRSYWKSQYSMSKHSVICHWDPRMWDMGTFLKTLEECENLISHHLFSLRFFIDVLYLNMNILRLLGKRYFKGETMGPFFLMYKFNITWPGC